MSTKRAEILETAQRLFAARGFYATGVDTIMAEAGISKRTLYKYFPTKNHLIDAVVQEYVGVVKQFWAQMDPSAPAREQILGLFRIVQGALGSPGLNGCLTVRAMAEFGGSGLDVESSCQNFKRWERSALVDMAKRAGARDPATTGLRLLIIYEGMFAYTQVMRTAPPAEVIEWVGEVLDAAVG